MEQLSKSKIKLIQSLRQKKFRDRESKFIVEGVKSIRDFYSERPDLLDFIVSTNDRINSGEHFSCDLKTYKQISSLSNGDGTLAVFNQPESLTKESNYLLILDGIQDPGNLGTIIRTADWFGVDNIICSKDTVDKFNEKVVQSTMGSLLRVNLEYVDLSEFLSKYSNPVYGALMQGIGLDEQEITGPCAIIMGNEGNGIKNEHLPYVTHPIHIPGKGKAESLNVAIATAIILSRL